MGCRLRAAQQHKSLTLDYYSSTATPQSRLVTGILYVNPGFGCQSGSIFMFCVHATDHTTSPRRIYSLNVFRFLLAVLP